MATSATDPVRTGEITKFTEFIRPFVRSCGLYVAWRDDPTAPLPETVEPDLSYAEDIAELEAERITLQAMSIEQIVAQQRLAALAKAEEDKANREEEKQELARYKAMLAKVDAWTPPTAEHADLKEAMRTALIESMNFDCRGWDKPTPTQPLLVPPPPTPEEEIAAAEDWRRRSLYYNAESLAIAIKAAQQKTEWIRQLKASLSGF